MLVNSTTYANKKRKKPVLKQKKVHEGNEVVKSNPSKRHRDRLNGELDRLTDLLPFSDDVRSCLDKLSVLRLSVGYLRVKSYFKATVKKTNNNSHLFPGLNGQNVNSVEGTGFTEGDLLLQALNGFVMVVTSEGLVFYSSPTVKDYLGFQQSDVVHQSVFELIHTDDRPIFRQNLHFALNPPESEETGLESSTVLHNPEHLPPENSSFLERNFVCRFRCLLDNSSGFLALKFQGRLKYLHGQSIMRDNGTCTQPQLALFAIAMPVQAPSIVEIRSKTLLFQTKHKLDFTPIGIDNRGKIILGYSEIELCMKGSGYQFIHAADMMHCADNHLRMMKKGESGLTVFRLLSKTGSWVWVKSNAKLIYKGGRPEFVIAYQRALANSEGEEYLRQRRLQLPFSCTTGEAMLYDVSPTVDVSHLQYNKRFMGENVVPTSKPNPKSLLECFLNQDESVYTEPVETPLPMDEVFMDSRALVSIASNTWQENGATASTSEPVVVKEEAKQSVMAVINSLEELAKNGDFRATLQNPEIGDMELMDWEHSLKRLSQDVDKETNIRSDLDSLLSNEIFDYIDSVLFKTNEDCQNNSLPSCLTAVNNNLKEPFIQPTQICDQQLFKVPSPDPIYPQMNGVYADQPNTMNGQVGRSLAGSVQMSSSTQKLSHHGPLIAQATTNPPPLQHLQLQDIFSPSIELPELNVPATLSHSNSVPFQSCGQASINNMSCSQGISGQMQSGQHPLCPQNNMRVSAAAVNGQVLQSSVQQPNNVAQSVMEILPPLIPCSDFNSSNTPNIPVPFSTPCLQGGTQFQTHSLQFQQWLQSQSKLPHAGTVQNGHDQRPSCPSTSPESQTFPRAGLWPRTVNGLNDPQRGGQACGQAATESSCMFNQHLSSSVGGDGTLAHSGSSYQGGSNMDQSPPQGSCYFQWGHSEPVVGSAAINQVSVNISPMTVPLNMPSSEKAANIQHYLDCHRQTQQDDNAIFTTPACDIAVPDTVEWNC